MTDLAIRLCRDLAAGFADLGMRHAVLSPGSRNTPLLMGLSAESRIASSVHVDERSAAFHALGIAKATATPVALVCTSGTAAAHYLPAILEAKAARASLVVLTADRPPELRNTAAPQTIDQVKLYGDAVSWYHEVGIPDEAVLAGAAGLALRAWAEAVEPVPGPIHLNMSFREPLLSSGDIPEPGVSGIEFSSTPAVLEDEALRSLAGRLSGRRILVVLGGPGSSRLAAGAAAFASTANAAIVADPQCRFPSPSMFAHGSLLAEAGSLDDLTPDIVLRVGPVPTSKAVWSWLGKTDAPQLVLDAATPRDPMASARIAFRSDPARALSALAELTEAGPESWLEKWRRLDGAVSAAVEETLAAEPFPNEPAVVRSAYRDSPEGSLIMAASSMPIRDLDAFSGQARESIDVLANRGANGIDGLLSTAGGAAAGSGRPVVAVAGDISVLHDAAALGAFARASLPVTVVAINNDGGGIFHFLPQAALLPSSRFEQLFGTPHGHDLVAIATAFGVEARRIVSADELSEALGNGTNDPLFLEVATDRTENAALHRRLHAAAAEAVRSG